MIGKDIYRQYPEHWLKVSPWKVGEDRRMFNSEMSKLIDSKKAKKIDKHYAYRLLNKIYAEYSTDWFHEGNLYKVTAEDSLLIAPTHEFPHYITHLLYTVCWYQGNLFWSECSGDPEKRLYKFEGIDKTPGRFIRWANIKFLKPVFKLSYNKKKRTEYWQVI